MNRITNLALRAWVGAQVNATAFASEAKSTALHESHEHPFRRTQIASGAALGWMASSTGVALAASSDSTTRVTNIINGATTFVIALIAAASAAMFCWAAFLFVTSAGNSSTIEKAKTTGKNVVIGIALAASIFLIKSLIIDLVEGASGGSGGSSRDAGNQGVLRR